MTKTLGQFLAELRKKNGLTQQEVADRLNVSNKTVSHWERDENAPDLTMIPMIAEMYGVTCDRLLKREEAENRNAEPQIEIKEDFPARLREEIRRFKTANLISLALSAFGFIFLWGIFFGFFYTPYIAIIALAIMLLFEIAAIFLCMISISKMKEMRTSDSFQNIGDSVKETFDRGFGNFSFYSFFAIFSTLLFALPIACVGISDLLTLENYFSVYFPPILLFLLFVFLYAKEPYAERIAGISRTRSVKARKLNLLQLGAATIAGVLFLAAPFLETNGPDSPIAFGLRLAGLALLFVNAGGMIGILIKEKKERKSLLLPGIRNLLLTVPVFLLSQVIYTGSIFSETQNATILYWGLEESIFSVALGLILSIFIIFKLIDIILKRTENK